MQQRDVLIVGAGPAGSWAAARLARAGARVTLFDASHPREKPCGGGLTGRAVALLDTELRRRMTAVAVESLRFETDAAFVEMPLAAHGVTPQSALVVADRRSFDAMLLNAAVEAGARHVRERVCDVLVDGSGAEVRTARGSTRGAFLVGADGANSLVRRRLHAPMSRALLSIATGFFVHGATSTEIRIRAVIEPPGYVWSFPRRDHLAVGICAQADAADVARLKQIARAWLDESGLARHRRLEAYSWPIPSLRTRDLHRQHPAGPRWMLLGDAAGLVDPLTREGIYYALRSAELATSAIASNAPAPDVAYTAALERHVYPELARAADLKPRFFTSGFSDLLVGGLARSAAVQAVMVDLVAGEQSYRTLKRRLVATFEFKLAMELLRLQLRGRLARR